MRYSFFIPILIAALLLGSSVADAGVIGKPANNLGLVGYWSFDEGGGTRLGDSSGRGGNGTITLGGGTWASSARGQYALAFDGSSTYVDMAPESQPNVEDDQTISFWFMYPNAPAGAQNMISRSGGAGGSFIGFHDGISGCGGMGLGVWNFAGPFLACISSLPSENTWHHLVYTHNDITNTLYIDGSIASSSTTNINTGTIDNFDIGRYVGGNEYFLGKLDELRIYNRALSASEVSALYKTGATALGRSSASLDNNSSLKSGLVGHWTFEILDMQTSVADKSGNGNNGGFIGGATSSAKIAGKLGQGIRFDGVNDYVTMGSNASLEVNYPFTIATWVKTSSLSTWHTLVTTDADSVPSSLTGANLQLDPSGRVVCGASGGGITLNQHYSAGSLTPNAWQHVVCVMRGNDDVSIYVDGVAVSTIGDGQNSTLAGVAYSAGPARMADDSLGNSFFPGSLDDVRVYNRALSASEAKQLYNLGGGTQNAPVTALQKSSSLTSGLVGHWTFDGADIYPSIKDKSGNNNNGGFIGSATSSAKIAGKHGQAMRFNGTNNYIIVPDDASLDVTSEGTTAAWVKRNALGAWHSIVEKGSGGGDPAITYTMEINDFNGVTCYFGNGITNDRIDTGSDVTDLLWHHIACTWDGTTIRAYVDGVEEGSGALDITPVANGLHMEIGRYGAGFDYMNGSIDDLRVYNRALSAAELKQLYNLGR